MLLSVEINTLHTEHNQDHEGYNPEPLTDLPWEDITMNRLI